MRQIWLASFLVCLGCQTFNTDRPTRLPPPAQLPPTEPPMSHTLLQLEQDTIKQAKELTDQKQEAQACALLGDFVGKHPDRCEAHLAYAVLLLQTRQFEPARKEFEEFLNRCQDARPERMKMLIQAHAGLSDVAKVCNDAYGENLHLGIGRWLMTQNHNGVKVGAAVFSNSKLLDDALNDLTRARDLRPDEARPCWYLYRIYRAMNQMELAEPFLQLAQQQAAQSRLTELERKDLNLAVRSLKVEKMSAN